MAEIQIRLPLQFRGYVGGADSVCVEAETVGGALTALAARSAALGRTPADPGRRAAAFLSICITAMRISGGCKASTRR